MVPIATGVAWADHEEAQYRSVVRLGAPYLETRDGARLRICAMERIRISKRAYWTAARSGAARVGVARVMPPDIIIADIRPLTARQTSEFEQWEIYHD